MCQSKNIYLPNLATIEAIVDETPDVRTLRLVFQDEEVRENFSFRAGQFAEYSSFGSGESTFCIASAPTRKGYIECCFRSVGRVTESLRRLEVCLSLFSSGVPRRELRASPRATPMSQYWSRVTTRRERSQERLNPCCLSTILKTSWSW